MALREPERFVAKPQREGGGKQLYIHTCTYIYRRIAVVTE